MDTKKLVIVILVLIGVLAFMALGAGSYRDKQEGDGRPPDNYKDPDAGVELIDAATGWMRSDLDLSRMKTTDCTRTSRRISLTATCLVTIDPGSIRPSRFELVPEGSVNACFAFTREKLMQCVVKDLRQLDEPSEFTVAKDSGFLYLQCGPNSPTGCGVLIR